ncbi:alpha-ribazole phosphatase [Eubacterium oxidoreducens]|uniref:Alpha-ribazole phosphatase n=2 Tax=Eubacterium oxidoreducens TaxID=1732 RepID=A0A1G6AE11_EUBOX|nr:alpha-ribazole phosphatase [Eubacterium oxidoreducens]
MKIWLTRHGQTNLNKMRLMQGLTDEPLNETGIAQAKMARNNLGDLAFDAVYSSPLSRAITTASIIGNIPGDEVIIDERLIETNFGRYECADYNHLGVAMSLYWALPEIFPAPDSVETIASMTARSSSFLKELETKNYENVLISCHGGILRALCGYLCDKRLGIVWRPKPHNCEIRVFESIDGRHRFLKQYPSPVLKS